jgi:hypothetical protein
MTVISRLMSRLNTQFKGDRLQGTGYGRQKSGVGSQDAEGERFEPVASDEQEPGDRLQRTESQVRAQLNASTESKSKGKGQRAKLQQPPFSIFEFPFSSFQLPVSSYQSPISIFHIVYGMSDSGGRTSSK